MQMKANFPLTPALSFGAREPPEDAIGELTISLAYSSAGYNTPSPGGEGRDEGEQFFQLKNGASEGNRNQIELLRQAQSEIGVCRKRQFDAGGFIRFGLGRGSHRCPDRI